MVRLPVRKCFASVPTKSQNASTFCPYHLSFCTNQFTKRFVFLSEHFFFLYQPNHKFVRLFVRKSFASEPTKSQKISSFCAYNFSFCTSLIRNWFALRPYNLSFCTNKFTKRFGFLSVQLFLLHQPNHKKFRLSVRTIYPSVLTNSQKCSILCP